MNRFDLIGRMFAAQFLRVFINCKHEICIRAIDAENIHDICVRSHEYFGLLRGMPGKKHRIAPHCRINFTNVVVEMNVSSDNKQAATERKLHFPMGCNQCYQMIGLLHSPPLSIAMRAIIIIGQPTWQYLRDTPSWVISGLGNLRNCRWLVDGKKARWSGTRITHSIEERKEEREIKSPYKYIPLRQLWPLLNAWSTRL